MFSSNIHSAFDGSGPVVKNFRAWRFGLEARRGQSIVLGIGNDQRLFWTRFLACQKFNKNF